MAMDKYGVEDRKALLESELRSIEKSLDKMEKVAEEMPILRRKKDIEEELLRIKSEEDLA